MSKEIDEAIKLAEDSFGMSAKRPNSWWHEQLTRIKRESESNALNSSQPTDPDLIINNEAEGRKMDRKRLERLNKLNEEIKILEALDTIWYISGKAKGGNIDNKYELGLRYGNTEVTDAINSILQTRLEKLKKDFEEA